MIDDPQFYTKTMAKIYAEQKLYEKSAEIYRYLLNKEPGQQDITEALAEVEKKITDTGSANDPHLVALFDNWITLMFACHKVEKLRKLRHELEIARRL
ncbi:hypothetical protein ACFL9U_12020 [Thermodesulfobacteriota bacterium]